MEIFIKISKKYTKVTESAHKNVIIYIMKKKQNRHNVSYQINCFLLRANVLNVCSFIIFERMYIMNDKAKYLEVNEEKQQKIDSIREMFSKMYDFIEENCKSSRETSLIIT